MTRELTVALLAVLLVGQAQGAVGLTTGDAPFPSAPAAVGPADTVPRGARLRSSRQHVVVVVEDRSSITGELHRLEDAGDGWRRVGPPVPVVVGRAGVGPKREGDGRSPRGVFPLGPAFGYAATAPASLSLPYRPMLPGAVCVDDPRSEHYNRIVEPDGVDSVDWSSAEAMRRDRVHGDGLYEWGVEVQYNPEGRAGAGSCIFLHVWRGPESPTAGCTAMAEERLLELMAWLRPEDRPVLVQGSRSWLEGLRTDGTLPYPVPGSGMD